MNLRNHYNIACTGLRATDTLKKFPIRNVIIEPKHDGHSVTLQYGGGVPYLTSRGKEDGAKGVAVSANSPYKELEIPPWLHNAADACRDDGVTLLQGELVAKHGGSSNAAARKDAEKKFIAYDCLFYLDEDIRSAPLATRRSFCREAVASLRMCMPDASYLEMSEYIEHGVDFTESHLELYLQEIRDTGVEGFVVKPLNWHYGPTCGWKIKVKDNEDGFINGWKQARKHDYGVVTKADYVGSFQVCQTVIANLEGSGLEHVTFKEVADVPVSKLRIPLDAAHDYLDRVIEFQHSGWEESNQMFRFPQFVGWRPDKPAKECVWRKVASW